MTTRYSAKKPISKGGANSPSSSTSSCPRPMPEMSLDGHDTSASFSSMSRPMSLAQQQCLESGALVSEERSTENVTVTVRFRPLSPREIRHGEEIAWYADGDMMVRNEHNPSVAYAYDRVFGPTTTTRHVYDVAAQHVVSSAMEGINGTIFAYGVTSSGKTHTMHGDQRSPGIIPLAVKDAFSIIQETPSREFLLRVSYLEIYNEVVNDLLNPAGQNLKIREDFQGTFVEGIKEEVVLSPAHALSLIAAGEEHRHVGSNNFNLLSSRSHTIFTLTIESTPCGEYKEGEAVNLSQLNLIDLAGSESSKAETTGVRKKEGSYINKSLLTLGTVIAKLTDAKSTHIPYRDSKLTRLLQSSLSGQGRVSLICTVTPSSSNLEETHNTLKFAHRAKHIEVQALQNKIIDEKSLIKKYQNEIRCLKEELEQLKKGIMVPLKDFGENELVLLKQKLEDGHVKLQSRLEQEEEAKAALLGRIQRLTKLILVSTKATQSSRLPQRAGPRRRHSFGEEELAYLPCRRRDLILDDENGEFLTHFEGYTENTDDTNKVEKNNRKHGFLNWFKLRKRDGAGMISNAPDGDKSCLTKSTAASSTPQVENVNCPAEPGISIFSNMEKNKTSDLSGMVDSRVPNENYSVQETPLAGVGSIDHIDLLREQLKILSGEVAFHTSILKRLTEEALNSPRKDQIQLEIRKISEDIEAKNRQILSLEKQLADPIPSAPSKLDNLESSPSFAEVLEQLNQKSFELEVKAADNRVIQDQLQQKISECETMQETVSSLKEQLAMSLSRDSAQVHFPDGILSQTELCEDAVNSPSIDSKAEMSMQGQAMEIDKLRQKVEELTEARSHLETQNQKLVEESSYAKGLASAAGVELKALSEEVTKLMNYNEKLAAELATSRNSSQRKANGGSGIGTNKKGVRRPEHVIKREKNTNFERERILENALMEMQQREADLERTMEESKRRESYLENELANMWILVSKLKKSDGIENDGSEQRTESVSRLTNI